MELSFDQLWDFLAAILLLIGGVFLLVGSIGLVRLPDFMMRLHAPTKATTLGIGLVLITSMLDIAHTKGFLSVHELMITLFLFITAPITAHMLAKAAMHLDLPLRKDTGNAQHQATARLRRPPK